MCTKVSKKIQRFRSLLTIYWFLCMLPCLINMLVYYLLDEQAVLSITAQFTAYKAYCFTTRTHSHTQTCWHAHLSLGKAPQAVALAQRHSLSWVKMLEAKMHPVKMLRISDARIDKCRRWFEEKWCWSNCNTVDIRYKDVCFFLTSTSSGNSQVIALKTERKKYLGLKKVFIISSTTMHKNFFTVFSLQQCLPKSFAASKIKSSKALQQSRANETPCAQGVVRKDCLRPSRSCK